MLVPSFSRQDLGICSRVGVLKGAPVRYSMMVVEYLAIDIAAFVYIGLYAVRSRQTRDDNYYRVEET